MSGRRQGLRKSSRKGVDSSNETTYSTCESTAESESELNAATEEPLLQDDTTPRQLITGELHQAMPSRPATELDPDTTPVPSDLIQQVHNAIQCRTNEAENHNIERQTEANDQNPPNICRMLPTKSNASTVWVMTCPTTIPQDDDQTTTLRCTEQGRSDNARAIRSEDIPTLQRQATTEITTVSRPIEARLVAQREQSEQRVDDESKLCMTNREMFEERERVAKYILEAPPQEART